MLVAGYRRPETRASEPGPTTVSVATANVRLVVPTKKDPGRSRGPMAQPTLQRNAATVALVLTSTRWLSFVLVVPIDWPP